MVKKSVNRCVAFSLICDSDLFVHSHVITGCHISLQLTRWSYIKNSEHPVKKGKNDNVLNVLEPTMKKCSENDEKCIKL